MENVLELERKEIFKTYKKRCGFIILGMISLSLIFVEITFFAIVIGLLLIIFLGAQSESEYTTKYRENHFKEIESSESFVDIRLDLEHSAITEDMAYDSELFNVSEFTSKNTLSYKYDGLDVKISDIKSETSGKSKTLHAEGLFAFVDLGDKKNRPFFVTNNSKGISLFMQKVGNRLFPNTIKVEYKSFPTEGLSAELSVYAKNEEDYKTYMTGRLKDALNHKTNDDLSQLLEFSLVDNKLYVMFNHKHFNLRNKMPFFFKFDEKSEDTDQQIHDLKIYLSKTLHVIINEVK